MAGNLKLDIQPTYPTIKLKVLESLQFDNGVFYTEGDVIEVSPQEAVALVNNFPDNFEVTQE